MNKDFSPIEVEIPQLWRNRGKFVTFYCLFIIFHQVWEIFIAKQPLTDIVIFHAVLSSVCCSMLILYCLPVFLGHYPSWVIRILGRKYILRFIADCEKHVGNQRKEKGKLSAPSGWLKDQRIFWLGFVLCCLVIGLIAGLRA